MKGWYYKAFGLEVGPVSMESLIDQIKDGALSREDEVRFGDNGQWRRIGSIGSLMTHLPFETPATIDLDADRPSTSPGQTPKSGSQNWYYKSLGLEVGPVAMEKLIELITDRSLSREDEVRFGADGNWRRIGSIGPLMTHLPFETSAVAVSTNSMGTASRDEAIEDEHPNTLLDSLELNSLDDFEHEELTINHTALSKTSRSVGSAASSNSIAEQEPAKNASVPDLWWCTVQGKEYGPIELPKLIEWAAAGRLRRNDYVRRGLETYVLANDVPGLFPELPKGAKSETKASMDTVVQPVISNAAAKKATLSKSTEFSTLPSSTEKVDTSSKAGVPKPPSSNTVVEKAPTLSPVVETPATRPAISPASRSSSPTTPAQPSFASTPAPVVRTPSYPVAAAKSSSRSSGMNFGGLMKIMVPLGIGVVAIAVVGVLFYFGPSLIPVNSAKLGGQYKSLNTAYTEFASSRSSKSTDALKTAQKKLQEATKPVVDELDKIQNRTASQTNIIRLAKKLLQISKEELTTTTSKNEMEAEILLKIAAKELGVK